MAKTGRNEPCPCGSGNKYKKCCEGAERRDLLALVPDSDEDGGMQLVIETSQGVSIRSISPAMPLRLRERQGKEAEDATHGAAALWGLADFVFPPGMRRRGSGIRELGDGLLLVGDLGVVLQVKSREAKGESEDRERRWIAKQAGRALAQGRGTVRELRRAPAALTNLRGRSIDLDGKDLRWVVAVIIDHANPPPGAEIDPGDDAVVLLRRDWDFLFEQLKSTHAVGRYLERVAGESIALGDEPLRYYDLALADQEAEPSPLPEPYRVPGTKIYSEPLLPLAPVATENKADHLLYRTILEDIAGISHDPNMDEELRLLALADLDRLLVGQRAGVAQFLREKFNCACKVPPPAAEWHHRRIAVNESTQLGLGVCSRFDEEIQWAFGAWVRLRHHEFTQRVNPEEPVTVGVLLTPCIKKRRRQWDTSMTAVRGRIELDAEELSACIELWKREQDLAA